MSTPEHRRRNSFALYFHQHFLPEKLSGRSLNTVNNYKTAVTKLRLFAGHDITLAEVNDALLERFQEWLIDEGVSPNTARDYRALVRAIVRHAIPGECAKHRGKRPYQEAQDKHRPERMVGSTLLFQFLDEFYIPSRIGLLPASAEQIYVVVRLFDRWLGQPARLSDLTTENLRRFLHDYHAKGRAATTTNSKRRTLLTLWRAAADEDILPEPKPRRIVRVKEPKRLPEAWTIDEISTILRVCRQQQGCIGIIPANVWWESLILAVYDSGVRINAILLTETRDYQPDDLLLRIKADVQKDKTEQIFTLSPQTGEVIAQHYSRARELIWPWPHHRRTLWDWFRQRIIEPASVPADKSGYNLFHKIRRTCISYLAKENLMLAVRQADHCRPELTFKHYIDPRIAKPDVEATDVLPRPKLNEPNDNGNGGE